jgi:hypothetical protein
MNIQIKPTIKKQLGMYIVLTIIMAVFSLLMVITGNTTGFTKFFGDANPMTVFSMLSIFAGVSMYLLVKKDLLFVHKKRDLKSFTISVTLAGLLAILIILVDTKSPFAEDINVLFPESLLFYPVIAFLADILFHIIPLVVTLIISLPFHKLINYKKFTMVLLVITAFIDPIFQIFFSTNETWVIVYMTFHVFFISLYEVFLFRKYGFVSMFLFRLSYYLFWHIIWGYIRLGLLF